MSQSDEQTCDTTLYVYIQYVILHKVILSGVLWTGCFSTWMKNLTRGQIDPDTWTNCKVMLTLFFFYFHYSSLILMFMAVEKCFALYFPLQIKIICTVKTTKKISLVTGIILFGFSAQLFFIRGEETDSNGLKHCVWVQVSESYLIIYYQIDAFLYSFLPLSVILIANFLIILKFMIAKCKNRHGGTQSVNQALSKSAVKGTAMLLTVSFAFVILTGLIAIGKTLMGDHPHVMVYGVTVIVQYLNHGTNGLLYCISGSRFRNELMHLFNCCGNKSVTRNMTNTNSVTSIQHLLPFL